MCCSYVRWAGADVVENLVSRRNWAASFVWRDVDGVIVGQEDPTWRANAE